MSWILYVLLVLAVAGDILLAVVLAKVMRKNDEPQQKIDTADDFVRAVTPVLQSETDLLAEQLRAMQGDTLATPEEQAVANKEYKENLPYFGYGFISDKEQLVPPVWLVYWSFRIMVGTGMALMLLFVLVAWFSRKKGNLAERRWLLHAGMWCLPLAYLGGQAGWIVAEVGRQPWAIQDLLPVNAAVSSLSPQAVQTTFFIFLALFTALLFVELRIMFKAIREHKAE